MKILPPRSNFLLACIILVLLAFSRSRASAQKDSPPQMLGVNLAGAEFGSSLPGTYNTHYTYPGPAQLDYYKARGIELIRLPFKWERLQHTLNGPLDSSELARMDTFLDQAEERGMRVIMDMHNYARYRISGTAYLIGSTRWREVEVMTLWNEILVY